MRRPLPRSGAPSRLDCAIVARRRIPLGDTAEASVRRLYWDFTGGQAAGTAEHFRRHVDDFVERASLAGCTTGTEAYTALHHAAWCQAPDAHCEVIIRSLRPRRATDPEPE